MSFNALKKLNLWIKKPKKPIKKRITIGTIIFKDALVKKTLSCEKKKAKTPTCNKILVLNEGRYICNSRTAAKIKL